MERPLFSNINDFDEFSQYYWYRQELATICKQLGLQYTGTKQELNEIIEFYFKGELVKPSKVKSIQGKNVEDIQLTTPLLACRFAFNQEFRNYFAQLTGNSPFKFTADMATAWRKVKEENDMTFTVGNMLDIFQGVNNNVKYDSRTCQWNQFVKDFCADKSSLRYHSKLKVASILWKIVKHSTEEKVYSHALLLENQQFIIEYKIQEKISQ